MRHLFIVMLLTALLAPQFLWAADSAKESAPVVQQTSDAPLATAPEIQPADFLSQVLEAIKNFGGLSMVLKIATVIMLLIASMKVSILNQLIWSHLGGLQQWLAPILGLIAGILNLGHNGPITLASVFAYISSGAGAIILHELLDSLKNIKGIGEVYVTMINFLESLLGGSKKKA